MNKEINKTTSAISMGSTNRLSGFLSIRSFFIFSANFPIISPILDSPQDSKGKKLAKPKVFKISFIF